MLQHPLLGVSEGMEGRFVHIFHSLSWGFAGESLTPDVYLNWILCACLLHKQQLAERLFWAHFIERPLIVDYLCMCVSEWEHVHRKKVQPIFAHF